MWKHDYYGSLWYLRPMVILTKCILIISFIAIALVFGILTLKIDINTQFHLKPFVFSIYGNTIAQYQFLGEIHNFWSSSISLCLVGEMA